MDRQKVARAPRNCRLWYRERTGKGELLENSPQNIAFSRAALAMNHENRHPADDRRIDKFLYVEASIRKTPFPPVGNSLQLSEHWGSPRGGEVDLPNRDSTATQSHSLMTLSHLRRYKVTE